MNKPINLQYLTLNNPVPDFIFKGMADYVKKSNRYQPQPQELMDKLTKIHKLNPDQIFLTAGVDEVIFSCVRAFGKNTFAFTPGYAVYLEATLGKLKTTNVLKNGVYKIPITKIANASLIFITNPNNPCGLTKRHELLSFIRTNGGAIVVVDETYADFTNESLINDVNDFDNLIILRSFSKSFGLAGMRIGFAVSKPKLLAKIAEQTQWANISYPAVGAAMTALDHVDHYVELRKRLMLEKIKLVDFLKGRNFKLVETSINAVLIEFINETQASQFIKHLEQDSIIVRSGNAGSMMGLSPNFVRISIGNQEEMNLLKHSVDKFKRK